MSAFWILILVCGFGYWASLHLHPSVRCRTCKGTGRHHGTVFTYASRACLACKGASRVARLGVRLFLGGAAKK